MYHHDSGKNENWQQNLFDFFSEVKAKEDNLPTTFSYDVPYAVQIQRSVKALLNTFSEEILAFLFHVPSTGRPGLTMFNVLCIVVAQSILKCSTMRACIKTINGNQELRRAIRIRDRVNICEGSVSRKTAVLMKRVDLRVSIRMYYLLYCKIGLILCVCIDSTIIKAREKAFGQLTYREHQEKTAREELEAREKPKKRKGRYPVGSPEEAECRRRKEEAKEREEREREWIKSCSSEELTKDLNRECGWTAKKNSQGKLEKFRGYKLHLLTDDEGSIAAYEITGANVADCTVAIPLKKECPRPYLYAAADKGYDSQKIRNYAEDTGHVAIIDRRNDKNCSCMSPFHRELYKRRTTVERSNGELKECFIPKDLHYRSSRLKFQFEISLFLFNMKRLEETAYQRRVA